MQPQHQPPEPKATGIAELFDASSPLTTPIIQRSYAWRRSEVEDFWNDITEARRDGRYHFLGLIVIDQNGRIHDGQQRLATTFLLLQVMKEQLDHAAAGMQPTVLQAVNAQGLQSALTRALQGEKQVPTAPLVIGTGDQTFLLDPSTGIAATRESQERLRRAHGELLAALTVELGRAGSPEDRIEFLWELWTYLRTQACVIELRVSAQTASNIFETLNTRGLLLSIPDLVKSYLLGSVDEVAQTEAMTTWEATTQTLKKETALNEFVLHYWGSRHGQIERSDLFSALKETVRGRSSAALTQLNSYRRDATIYAALRDADDAFWQPYGDDAIDSMRLINSLGLTQLRYLLLAVLREHPKGKNLNASNRRKRQADLLEWLSAWALRANVTGRTGGKPAETAYIDAATAVRTGEATTVDDVRQIFGNAGLAAGDTEFRNSFKRASLSATATRTVILAMETHLLGKNAPLGPKPKLTREHVLPQTWDKDNWRRFTKREQAEYVERTGNILLLTGITNNSLKNKSWKEKKRLILATGVQQLPLTQEALEEKDWTKAAINRHQARMADLAVSLWPE